MVCLDKHFEIPCAHYIASIIDNKSLTVDDFHRQWWLFQEVEASLLPNNTSNSQLNTFVQTLQAHSIAPTLVDQNDMLNRIQSELDLPHTVTHDPIPVKNPWLSFWSSHIDTRLFHMMGALPI